MAKVGYARVSSVGQSLDVQREKLGGCDKLFEEKRSGTTDARPMLKQCLGYVREGDQLIVTRIDRLARSTLHLCQIAETLRKKGVDLVVLDQNIDTSDATGRLLFNMFGAHPRMMLALLIGQVRAGGSTHRDIGVRAERSKATMTQMDGFLQVLLLKKACQRSRRTVRGLGAPFGDRARFPKISSSWTSSDGTCAKNADNASSIGWISAAWLHYEAERALNLSDPDSPGCARATHHAQAWMPGALKSMSWWRTSRRSRPFSNPRYRLCRDEERHLATGSSGRRRRYEETSVPVKKQIIQALARKAVRPAPADRFGIINSAGEWDLDLHLQAPGEAGDGGWPDRPILPQASCSGGRIGRRQRNPPFSHAQVRHTARSEHRHV